MPARRSGRTPRVARHLTRDQRGKLVGLAARWAPSAGLGVLCAALAALGFGACFLLLTTGLEVLDATLAWVLTAFGLVWGVVWFGLLVLILLDAAQGD